MITAKYGDVENSFIIVTFANGRITEVPCDANNCLYTKIIESGITIQPFGG